MIYFIILIRKISFDNKEHLASFNVNLPKMNFFIKVSLLKVRKVNVMKKCKFKEF